ncbi:MAG: hypothetical protein IJC83_03635 [Oscillospiraceae bacterium]|nr:hypothetical protein [Oscillospiraceae bacterium]
MKKVKVLVAVLVLILAVASMTGCQTQKSPGDKISDGIGSVIDGANDFFGN